MLSRLKARERESILRRAMRAAAGELDGEAVEAEAAGGGLAPGAGGDLAALDLRHLAAPGADQELAGVVLLRLRAADIGVQGFQPVDEALGDEEIERPVDGGRGRGTHPRLAMEGLQNRIGADGLVLAPDDLEHAAPDGRQAGPAAGADGFGPV